jgi:hypothetical protein
MRSAGTALTSGFGRVIRLLGREMRRSLLLPIRDAGTRLGAKLIPATCVYPSEESLPLSVSSDFEVLWRTLKVVITDTRIDNRLRILICIRS